MHISEINIYPIKSLKGIALQSAVVNKRGLECDRRWVLVDSQGTFLTQRELAKMATIAVAIENGELRVESNGAGPLKVAPLVDGPRVATKVWDRAGEAIAYDAKTNEWFSDVLGTKVQLRYMPDDAGRPVKVVNSEASDRTGFADAYPLLLGNEASMADLNQRIAAGASSELPPRPRNADTPPKQGGELFSPLPINRFRPNIVVSGADAWAEDAWAKIRVGEAVFRVVKPSDRCVVTTTDQETGERGKEPLKTLATFRMSKNVFPDMYEAFGLPANSVLFGENMIPDTPGATIRVGDSIEVLATRS
jgi:uncharacterized protein YcbX